MGQLQSVDEFVTAESGPCASFLEDYAEALLRTYRFYCQQDKIIADEKEKSKRLELNGELNRNWIEFTKVLHAVRDEIRSNNCLPTTVNQFEALCNDTLSVMGMRLHTRTQRLLPQIDHGLCMYGPTKDEAAEVMRAAYNYSPCAFNLGRETLEYTAAIMQLRMRAMFEDAGRTPGEGARFELIDHPDGRVGVWPAEIPGDTDMFFRLTEPRADEHTVRCGNFAVTMKTLRNFASNTVRYIDDEPKQNESNDEFFNRYTVSITNSQRYDLLVEETKKLEAKRHAAERIVVAGPVHVVFDSALVPQEIKGQPILCVSAAAPNLADPRLNDRGNFVIEAGSTTDKDGKPLGCHLVKDPKLLEPLRCRVRRLWNHVLAVFDEHRVNYPVLNAIGCGVYKGRDNKEVRDLPELYASQLCELLCSGKYKFQGVLIALPRFNESDERNYVHYRDVFKKNEKNLPMPVLLSSVHSMIDLADRIARDNEDVRVGILNPSDYMAMLGGFLGMFCEGSRGTIALEEIIGIQTTLRAGHVGVNPNPWLVEGIKSKQCIVRRLPEV